MGGLSEKWSLSFISVLMQVTLYEVQLRMEYGSDLVRSRARWLFFFSSRRRHTRFDCDWSSDVCSSDLDAAAAAALVLDHHGLAQGAAQRLGHDARDQVGGAAGREGHEQLDGLGGVALGMGCARKREGAEDAGERDAGGVSHGVVSLNEIGRAHV